MKTLTAHFLNAALLITVSMGLLACKPASVQIKPPQPSDLSYPRASQGITMGIIDARKVADKTLATGVVNGEFLLNQAPLDPIPFLKKYLKAELQSRGFAVNIQPQARQRLYIHQFTTHTTRSGPYAPFVVWAALRGEWVDDQRKHPIHALVVREYFPKFTYSELDDPLYSKALELLVKETASKIAQHNQGGSISDARVTQMSESLFQKKELSETDLYPLVFSGNDKAIATLLEFAQSKEKNIRTTAAYGLGLFNTRDYLPTFTSFYLNAKDPLEKTTFFKSILELKTPQAVNWAQKEWQKHKDLPKDNISELIVKTGELYGLK